MGTPELFIDSLIDKGIKDLTVIIGTNPETGRQMNAGELEVQLVPQGTSLFRSFPAALYFQALPAQDREAAEKMDRWFKI